MNIYDRLQEEEFVDMMTYGCPQNDFLDDGDDEPYMSDADIVQSLPSRYNMQPSEERAILRICAAIKEQEEQPAKAPQDNKPRGLLENVAQWNKVIDKKGYIN